MTRRALQERIKKLSVLISENEKSRPDRVAPLLQSKIRFERQMKRLAI